MFKFGDEASVMELIMFATQSPTFANTIGHRLSSSLANQSVSAVELAAKLVQAVLNNEQSRAEIAICKAGIRKLINFCVKKYEGDDPRGEMETLWQAVVDSLDIKH